MTVTGADPWSPDVDDYLDPAPDADGVIFAEPNMHAGGARELWLGAREALMRWQVAEHTPTGSSDRDDASILWVAYGIHYTQASQAYGLLTAACGVLNVCADTSADTELGVDVPRTLILGWLRTILIDVVQAPNLVDRSALPTEAMVDVFTERGFYGLALIEAAFTGSEGDLRALLASDPDGVEVNFAIRHALFGCMKILDAVSGNLFGESVIDLVMMSELPDQVPTFLLAQPHSC